MKTRTSNGSLLTTGETAHKLHTDDNTGRRWSNRGILKSYRTGPRRDRRFRSMKIAGLLASLRVPES